uniref:5'-3' DNA helicase ZGRF1-like N-terminal domain-containing protein n=1 Tax=Zosterops lateralis melanops TaxID=1220523 RepID=A0A8D2NPR3_ZOSLA
MASQEFTVLYTHQKMKKSKTWQDGILRVRTGRNQKAETPAVERNGVKFGVLPPRHLPVGLKRKVTVCFCSKMCL